MPIKILMPALSPTMTKGNITKWNKKEGDYVKSGDVLFEIETDKAIMEVESIDDGYLKKIIIHTENNVPVNNVIAILAEKNDSDDDIAKTFSEIHDNKIYDGKINNDTDIKQSVTSDLKTDTVTKNITENITDTIDTKEKDIEDTRIKISPLAKKIALSSGIDLKSLTGSGPNGRIVKQDIETYISAKKNNTQPQKVINTKENDYNDINIPALRMAIATNLTESKKNVPHFYMTVSCNTDSLISMRKMINESQEQKISINDMVVKACSIVLDQCNNFKTVWHDNNNKPFIRQHSTVSLAVAVSIPGGVITPVIKNAEQKDLLTMSGELHTLIKKAREMKLSPDEYSGGLFTITNLGMLGVEEFASIVPLMQSGILSIGMSKKTPVVINNEVTIANMMSITLASDHRVIDGADAAEFLSILKNVLENPIKILL